MQAKFTKLVTLGYTGSINDMYLKWLRDRGATATDVQTAEQQWLVTKGQTVGPNNDRWYRYLLSLAFTGARPEMEKRFWESASSN